MFFNQISGFPIVYAHKSLISKRKKESEKVYFPATLCEPPPCLDPFLHPFGHSGYAEKAFFASVPMLYR